MYKMCVFMCSTAARGFWGMSNTHTHGLVHVQYIHTLLGFQPKLNCVGEIRERGR